MIRATLCPIGGRVDCNIREHQLVLHKDVKYPPITDFDFRAAKKETQTVWFAGRGIFNFRLCLDDQSGVILT